MVSLELAIQTKEIELHKKSLISFILPTIFHKRKHFKKCFMAHYGLKLSIYKILNFPLESPSQIAPKFYSFVEQCRTEIQTQVEAGYAWEGFHVKICLQKCVEIE